FLEERKVTAEEAHGQEHERGEDQRTLAHAPPGRRLDSASPRGLPLLGRRGRTLSVAALHVAFGRRLDLLALVVDPDVFPLVAPFFRSAPPLLPARHAASLAPPGGLPALDARGPHWPAQVVCEVPPVRSVEENDVRVVARGQAALAVSTAEDVRGVDRACAERFGRRKAELRAGQRAEQGQAFE